MAGQLVLPVNRPSDGDLKKAADVLEGYRVEERAFASGCKSFKGFEVNDSAMKRIESWAASRQMHEAAIPKLKDSLKVMSDSEQSEEKLEFKVETSDGFVVVKLDLAYSTSPEKKKDIMICFGSAHFKNTESWYNRAYRAVFGGKSGQADNEFRNAVNVTCRNNMANAIDG